MQILFCKWAGYGQEAVAEEFRRQGHSVDFVPYDLHLAISDRAVYETERDRLCHYLEHNSCDMVFSLNYFPLLSEVCEQRQTMYVSWCVDAPLLTLFEQSVYNSCNYIFDFDRSVVEYLRARGVKHIYHLPLYGDIQSFSPVLQEETDGRWDAEISHVGSVYNDKDFYDKCEQLLPPYLRGFFEGVIEAHVNMPGCNLLEECITPEIEEVVKKTVELHLGDNFIGDWKTMFATSFLGYKVTTKERCRILRKLSENYDVHVYSKGDLTEIPHAKLCGTVDYDTQMPLVFRDSRINLNMTLRNIRTGISLRVFDVLACGGFLITNYQQEIAELFQDGRDLVMYYNMEDLERKVAYYLNHEEERRRIAKSGFETIQKYHTVKCRLETMWEILQNTNSGLKC